MHACVGLHIWIFTYWISLKTLSCSFSSVFLERALTLLVGHQEEHLARKKIE